MNDNSGDTPLVRSLRASVAWCAWFGVPVATVFPVELRERRVVDVARERAEGRR